MKNRALIGFKAAFTLIEVLICLAAVFILAAVFLPALARPTVNDPRIRCVNNLKQVGLAFRIWAGDNNDRNPTQVSVADGGSAEVASDVWRTFQLMSNEIAIPSIIACWSDDRASAKSWETLSNTNISFFMGLDANESSPQMVLAGDRNVTNSRPTTNRILTVTREGRIGWTHQLHNNRGNVALADGSVLQISSGGLQAHVRQATNAVQRLAIPE
jgi:prepilin-type processing-associated H-X9-DG protein